MAVAHHPVHGGDPVRRLGRFLAGARKPPVGTVGEQPADEIRDGRADGG